MSKFRGGVLCLRGRSADPQTSPDTDAVISRSHADRTPIYALIAHANLRTDHTRTDQSHTDQSHTDQSHTDQSHTDQSHTDQSHTDHTSTNHTHTDRTRDPWLV